MYRATHLAFALGLSPVSLGGQVSIDTALTGLRPGQVVRARTLDGGRIESRILAVDGESLTLRLARREDPLPGGAIDSLWVRRSGAGTGALIGAVLAAVPSFLISESACSAEGTGCNEWFVVVVGLAGAAGGALAGAMVGAFVPRWRLRYARPESGAVLLATPRPGIPIMLSVRFD